MNDLAAVDFLAPAREAFARFGPPVVVFNKSHSGSRLLARVLERSGVFMGAERNESEDALPILPVVERLVVDHYPDYARLLARGDRGLTTAIGDAFAAHLRGFKGGRWGWKLSETAYVLPVVHALFPDAYFVHLIRDGRDVAFSNHVAPRTAFWKKIYFNTADIRRWRGMPLSSLTYRLLAPLYNARHWSNSVSVGREAGRAVGTRYIEVRYERLVSDFTPTVSGMLETLALQPNPDVLNALAAEVFVSSVGKFGRRAAFQRWLAMRELQPALAAFGYGGEAGSGGDAS